MYVSWEKSIQSYMENNNAHFFHETYIFHLYNQFLRILALNYHFGIWKGLQIGLGKSKLGDT